MPLITEVCQWSMAAHSQNMDYSGEQASAKKKKPFTHDNLKWGSTLDGNQMMWCSASCKRHIIVQLRTNAWSRRTWCALSRWEWQQDGSVFWFGFCPHLAWFIWIINLSNMFLSVQVTKIPKFLHCQVESNFCTTAIKATLSLWVA